MNIWIVFIGEELPIDGPVRPWRYGILADMLAAQGHSVTRWAPTFYAHKKQRSDSDRTICLTKNYQINLIYDRGYKRPLSFARIRHYQRVATRFAIRAEHEPLPDIILAGLPSPCMCEACVEYGHRHHIPVLVDVRDLWPDIFLDVVPLFLRPLARLYLRKAFRRNHRVFRDATGVLAITNDFLNWGLRYAGRGPGRFDGTFTHAYLERQLSDSDISTQDAFLRRAGVDYSKLLICFFGSFEQSYDLETVITAARLLLHRSLRPSQIVLCGDGKKWDNINKRAVGLSNVILLGRVQQPTILRLMQLSSIGLATYVKGATHTLSNKVIEYFCGGMAVVASHNKHMHNFLQEAQCGLTYEPHNPHSLATALQTLLADPALLEKMKANARTLFEKSFTPAQVYGSMVRHIESVYASTVKIPLSESSPPVS